MGGRTTKVFGWLVAAVTLLVAVPSRAATPVFGPPFPVNGAAGSDTAVDGAPRLATDGQGTWLAVWAATGALGTDSDVLSARSTDHGVSWTSPVPVNGSAATDEAFDFAPAVATDGDGTWVAVWAATNGPDTDIFVARSTNAGTTWSTPAPLYADAASDTGNDDRPQIAVDGAGHWLVVWDAPGRFGNDRDVLYARSLDGGVGWTAPAALGGNATTDRGTDQRPHAAPDGAGGWLVVWASTDSLGNTIGIDFDIFVTRSTDGGATWSPVRALNGNAIGDQALDDRPQLATDGAGTWVVVWVSDDTLADTIGPDLDVLTARSVDGGATWSTPRALNGNAATDTGADGAPVVATDRQGTWVAVWETNDPMGGALGGTYDVVMAHSLDGGANWSTARQLDPDAPTDARRDVSPQIVTDAHGVWNAVWAGAGGTLGADGDVLRAGGRERCGDGNVDPGEQCDDGNTRGGDACPATCEFPPAPTPIATPTLAGGGAESTPGPLATSSGSPSATGTSGPNGATPTVDPNATPTATAIGPTPTADPLATPTATPTSGPGGPTSTTPDASPTPTGGATPGAATGIPTPAPPGFAGGLSNRAAAKAAVACQRTIVKAGAQLVSARLGHLGRCARSVQRCVQTLPDDAACLTKAAVRCDNALAALAKADAKAAASVRKRCGGTLGFADVLGAAGLGFGALACLDGGAAEHLDEWVGCVVGAHGCEGARVFELLQPRAKELLRLPGMHAARLDAVVCLPDHGGDGAGVGDPAGLGKAVDVCGGAIVKAGSAFVKKRLARRAKCADALFTCAQLAPGDPACLAKARARCDLAATASAADERALGAGIAKRCNETTIAYATLRVAGAANLDALASSCAAVGVPALDSLADYQQCVARSEVCRVATLLELQAPRVAELLAVAGRTFDRAACGGR
jgi:cysteine-rich repeat protein